jgi:hypothetical protein
MKTNVGTADRVIRIVAGLALLSLVFILESSARWWGLVGLLPLATGWSAGVRHTCPLASTPAAPGTIRRRINRGPEP